MAWSKTTRGDLFQFAGFNWQIIDVTPGSQGQDLNLASLDAYVTDAIVTRGPSKYRVEFRPGASSGLATSAQFDFFSGPDTVAAGTDLSSYTFSCMVRVQAAADA